MSWLRRIFWTPWHLLFSFLALAAWCGRGATGRPLAFTHWQDVDSGGIDRQMGPLVDALARREPGVVEVTLVPLDAALFANWSTKRRGFVSWAAVLLAARIGALFVAGPDRLARARTAVSAWLLRRLRPPVLYLIDESGSAQPLVRAARRLGIPTVGVQHGDFQRDNHQYRPREGTPFRVEAVDVLCVWSPWFQERLLAVSPIYDASNTRVCGRLRIAAPVSEPRREAPVRVLVLGEADPACGPALAPFLTALEQADGIEPSYRAHPSEGRGGEVSDLDVALDACDVAVGLRSSALMEALFRHRPVVVVGATESGDDLADAGLAVRCSDPGSLPARCLALADGSGAAAAERSFSTVWGGVPEDPIRQILNAGEGKVR